MKLRNTLLIVTLAITILPLAVAQKGSASNVIGLKVTAKVAKALKNVRTEAFILRDNIMYAESNYKIIYDKRTGKYIFIKIEDDDGGVKPMDGTQDIGGGLTLRCASNCPSGCNPTSSSGAGGTSWYCSSCSKDCASSIHVPAERVIAKVTRDGEDTRRDN